MQYHLNGFKPGDLQVADATRKAPLSPPITALPTQVDVLIVGCGPAGLTLARQLAEFSDIKTCIVDQKSGPMLFGQADGVSCRTIEIMQAFGLSETIVKEAYWLNQTAFWEPDKLQPCNIIRAQKIADARIGLSEFPHVVLNQARIHDLLLDGMCRSPAQLQPNYSRRLEAINIDASLLPDIDAYPFTAVFECTDPTHVDKNAAIQARFVVGCDGARSAVRHAAGIALRGDSANKAWGVMDVLMVTDFPDIRVKSFIQSADNGAIMIVPREGGYLVRLYIELDSLKVDQRVSKLEIGLDDLVSAAKRVFHPFVIEIKEVPWWSVYEIGQRVADGFDNTVVNDVESIPRLFIAGDACHTHSPKAGQGMNVSIHDAFNLGWKLASVILGQCQLKVLRSYSAERREIAQQLIALDKTFAQLVAAKPGTQDASMSAESGTVDIQKYLAKKNAFIAGTGVEYGRSAICGDTTFQYLAHGFQIGQRFHSEKVVRLADGRVLHLGYTVKADGRWRLFIFSDEVAFSEPSSKLSQLVQFLAESVDSPVRKYTKTTQDIDAVIDVYTILPSAEALSITQLPDFLWPAKGRYGLRDYEKVFYADHRANIYASRGVSRDDGCIAVVRPDQHVAHVLPLDAHAELADFFDGFMLP